MTDPLPGFQSPLITRAYLIYQSQIVLILTLDGVEEDPMGSDHLPIFVECVYGFSYFLKDASDSKYRSPKRPKLSLNNFDKKLFPIIIQESMNALSLNQNLVDSIQVWYDSILDCSLKAGAILYKNSIKAK